MTGLPEMQLSAMAGRQLPFFSLIMPAWMVCTMSGWRGLRGVWPAVLVCGGTFASVQFLISNFLGPSLTDVAGGVASMAALAVLLRFWQPRDVWRFREIREAEWPESAVPRTYSRREIARAWTPWIILSACVFLWGTAAVSHVPQRRHAADAAVVGSQPRNQSWWERPNILAGISELVGPCRFSTNRSAPTSR